MNKIEKAIGSWKKKREGRTGKRRETGKGKGERNDILEV